MKFNLPDNARFVDYTQFSQDGYYDMAPGETVIFPWQVQPSGGTEIYLAQTDMNTQDHTVQAWLSHQPIDNVMFDRINYMNYLDIQRNGTSVTIYDERTNKNKGLLRAKSGRGFHLNVKNGANEPNAFKLTFSYIPGNQTSSTGTSASTPDVNHSEKVGTMTDYGEIVAQLDHGLTIVKSTNGSGDLISLMRGDKIISAIRIIPDPNLNNIDDIRGTYIDGSDNDAPYNHLMMEWVVNHYNPLNISGLDASNNRIFWDILIDYPGDLKFTFVDRDGKPVKLTKANLECKTLWERI